MLASRIWITELSWSSQHPRHNNSFARGVGGQKRQLQGAFGLLKRKQKKWRIKRVYWFSVDDVAGRLQLLRRQRPLRRRLHSEAGLVRLRAVRRRQPELARDARRRGA